MLLGHIPDVPDPRDLQHPVAALVGSVYEPDRWSLSEVVPRVRSQIAQNCVNCAGGGGLELRANVVGRPIRQVSSVQGYTLARLRGGYGLADRGCVPRDFFEVLREWGVCSEDRWPETIENVSALVPADVIQAGAEARVERYSRFASTGEQRAIEVRRALAAGHPVFFAMQVDKAFEDLESGEFYEGPESGQIVGGHAMLFTGYDADGLEFLNSWGLGFADKGFGRMLWSCLKGPFVDDLYAFEVAPEAVR